MTDNNPKRGQPPKPAIIKKMPISVKLPQWLLDWFDTQPQSRARLIEDALIKVHKLKPPKVDKDEN